MLENNKKTLELSETVEEFEKLSKIESKKRKKELREEIKKKKKEERESKKANREEKARKLLNYILKPKKIKRDSLKKILKLLIYIIAILFFVEVFMYVFDLESVFSEYIRDSIDNGNGKLVYWIYVVIFLVAFIQTLPIFNMPMLPLLFVLFELKWLSGRVEPITTLGENLQAMFTPNAFILTIAIMGGYMLGVLLNYYLGYLLGDRAYAWVSEEDNPEMLEKWSNIINGKAGRSIYFATVLLPVFPDDLLLILVGASRMNSKFVFISNLIGRYIGLICMMAVLYLIPSSAAGEFPIMIVVYGLILAVALIINFVNNRWLNMNMPKNQKIDSSFEEVINRIKKRTSVVEEVISDIAYKIDGKTKSKFNTAVDLLVFAVIDYENYINRKIRILVRCKSANYFEVIFDHTYLMSEKIETLIKDLETEREAWKEKIIT